MSEGVFNKELLELAISTVRRVDYVIGVDATDKNSQSYCLARVVQGESEIILMNLMTDEKDFEEEVANLTKYFNAKVIRDE